MMPISHQYHLKIRQEPERARVTGAKEKGEQDPLFLFNFFGRLDHSLTYITVEHQIENPWILHPSSSCISEMPVIQHSMVLQVPSHGRLLTVGRNYLQSPYYFMCCNLWHAEKDEAIPTDKGSVLAGTLVSSLHRLKDADNTG